MARMDEESGVYRALLGKPEGKRPLGRPRRRWVDNIRMDLQEVGYGYMDWIGLAQDRDRWRTLVSAVMNLLVPSNGGNFLTSCKPVSFSRRTLRHGVSKKKILSVEMGGSDQRLFVGSSFVQRCLRCRSNLLRTTVDIVEWLGVGWSAGRRAM